MANNKTTSATEHIILYSRVTREIAARITALRGQIKKRIIKGLPVTVEFLAENSAVRKIVRDAANMARTDTWCQPTADDLRDARHLIADEVFDEAILETKQNI